MLKRRFVAAFPGCFAMTDGQLQQIRDVQFEPLPDWLQLGEQVQLPSHWVGLDCNQTKTVSQLQSRMHVFHGIERVKVENDDMRQQ
jgi:hypothetical protein